MIFLVAYISGELMLIRKHRDVAHTLERAFEREDLAIRDSEPFLDPYWRRETNRSLFSSGLVKVISRSDDAAHPTMLRRLAFLFLVANASALLPAAPSTKLLTRRAAIGLLPTFAVVQQASASSKRETFAQSKGCATP